LPPPEQALRGKPASGKEIIAGKEVFEPLQGNGGSPSRNKGKEKVSQWGNGKKRSKAEKKKTSGTKKKNCSKRLESRRRRKGGAPDAPPGEEHHAPAFSTKDAAANYHRATRTKKSVRGRTGSSGATPGKPKSKKRAGMEGCNWQPEKKTRRMKQQGIREPGKIEQKKGKKKR